MLRRLVLLLLLGNLLYFVWTRGWLDEVTGLRAHPDREPERLARQVRPETVTIGPPGALRPSSEPAAASAPVAAAAPACFEAGPFPTGASISAIAALQAALPAGSWTEVRTERPGSWIVYMGRYPSREAYAKKEEELKRTRVAYEEVSSPAELELGFSLGRFDQRAAADRALEQLAQRGVRTARVVELVAPATLHILRVEKADAALAAQLNALRPETLGRGFLPCGSS